MNFDEPDRRGAETEEDFRREDTKCRREALASIAEDRAIWLRGLQIGDAVKVIDFWEETYKTSVTRTTDRFIWLKFDDTKETIRFTRRDGYQARGGIQMCMPGRGRDETAD